VESSGYSISLFLPRISDNFPGNTVKFLNQILGHILNLFLEKAIAHRGNLFALPRKDFSFSVLEFLPQTCNPGNLGEAFLLGTATKILDEFPAGEVEYPGNSFCTPEQCCKTLFKIIWPEWP
jgi:hypothetical protein